MPTLQKECAIVDKRQSGKFQHGCSVAGKMSELYYSTLDPPSQKRYNEKNRIN